MKSILSLKWVARLLALALVVVLLAYAGLSWKLFDVISRVDPHCGTGDDGRPQFSTYTPAAFGTSGLPADLAANVDTTAYAMPIYQNVAIDSRDGVRLAAWWIPADRPDAPVVVMAHGAGSCRRDPVMLLPAGMLHRNGFAVLMVDLRNQGDSTGTDGRFAGGTREYLDVLGAWDCVRARGIPAARIGLFGESNGASTVVIAAGAEPQVTATWEDSGYADTWAAISEEVRRHGFPEALTFGARLWGLLDGIDLDRHPGAAALDSGTSTGTHTLNSQTAAIVTERAGSRRWCPCLGRLGFRSRPATRLLRRVAASGWATAGPLYPRSPVTAIPVEHIALVVRSCSAGRVVRR